MRKLGITRDADLLPRDGRGLDVEGLTDAGPTAEAATGRAEAWRQAWTPEDSSAGSRDRRTRANVFPKAILVAMRQATDASCG